MKLVPLDDVTEQVEKWQPRKQPLTAFQYIDLSSIDKEQKAITETASVQGKDAPSRARQLVKSSDVLVSTVRPNLNAVAVVPPTLNNATASTGFSVLRASTALNSQYLFHWVRTSFFVANMTRLATGANYPAVSDRIVRSSKIPLPPVAEQRCIATILDKADSLRTKYQEKLARLDELPQAIFHEMFENPSEWLDRWGMTTIGALATESTYGTSKKAGDAGKWPVLRMGNITDDGHLDLTDLKYLDLTAEETSKYTVKRGDLLFNRTNSLEKVGKAAVVRTEQDLAVAGYLVRVRFQESAVSEFVAHYLASSYGIAVRRKYARAAVNQANISASEMRRLPIPDVPIALMRELETHILEIETQRTRLLETITVVDELFASLQARAFSGKL